MTRVTPRAKPRASRNEEGVWDAIVLLYSPTGQRLGTAQAGSDGSPYSRACEHVAHILMCFSKRTFCLQRTHTFGLLCDLAEER
jgi:hypothetical protein